MSPLILPKDKTPPPPVFTFRSMVGTAKCPADGTTLLCDNPIISVKKRTTVFRLRCLTCGARYTTTPVDVADRASVENVRLVG